MLEICDIFIVQILSCSLLHFNTALYIQVLYVKDTGMMTGCFLGDLHHVNIKFLYVKMSISEFTVCCGVCFRVNHRYLVRKEVFKLFGKEQIFLRDFCIVFFCRGNVPETPSSSIILPKNYTTTTTEEKKKVLLPT